MNVCQSDIQIFCNCWLADSCTNFFLAITFPIPNTKSIKFKEVRGVSTKLSCKNFSKLLRSLNLKRCLKTLTFQI